MGKITVETCHIEGLKVITPTVFGDARGYFMETYNYKIIKRRASTRSLFRTTSRLPKKEFFAAFIFRKSFRRTSWCVL